MKNPVGPVLRMGDQIEDIVAAIRDDNPNQEIAVIDRGVIAREERYLERKFGARYTDYKRRVRRWI